MSNKYNIPKLSRSFTPHFWQNDVNNRFIDILMASLAVVNENTQSLEEEILERVGYSVQRLSLERSLNNRFDRERQRIIIENGAVGTSGFVFNENESPSANKIIYVFNEAETTPSGSDTPYFFNEDESGTTSITEFTVTLPMTLSSRENEIRSWIDFVRIFGTRYTLRFVL